MENRIKKLYEYLDGYGFLNESEVSMAVQEYMLEEKGKDRLSFNDCMAAGEIAEHYIKDNNLRFEIDLVMTLDREHKSVALSDLNNVLNEKQIERLETKCNSAFLNACDCLNHGYGKEAWNKCGLNDEALIIKTWNAAKEYLNY